MNCAARQGAGTLRAVRQSRDWGMSVESAENSPLGTSSQTAETPPRRLREVVAEDYLDRSQLAPRVLFAVPVSMVALSLLGEFRHHFVLVLQ